MKPLVGIIIVNWNQAPLTLQTIASVKKISHHTFNYQIFLIDNGSNDQSFTIFKKKYSPDSQVTLIKSNSNTGFSGGNNLGIVQALKHNCSHLLLLNNDVIVHKDFLTNLLPVLNQPQIELVSPKIYFAPHHEFHQNRYSPQDIGKVIWSAGGYLDWNNIYGHNLGLDEVDRGQYDQLRTDLEFTTACCLLIKRAVFSSIPQLDESFFMYYEDVDFCVQVKRLGYLIAYQPTSIIWHYNSGSTQAGGGPFHDYFLTRNRLIFGFRYASLKTKLALFRESLRQLITGTTWQKKGILDFYTLKRGRGSWLKN